jgi:hypothetical protein
MRLLMLMHHGLHGGAYRGLLLLELGLHYHGLLHHGGHCGQLNYYICLWLVRLRPVVLHG